MQPLMISVFAAQNSSNCNALSLNTCSPLTVPAQSAQGVNILETQIIIVDFEFQKKYNMHTEHFQIQLEEHL